MSGVMLKEIIENSSDMIDRAIGDIKNAVLAYGDMEFKEALEELIAREQELGNTIQTLKDYSEDM